MLNVRIFNIDLSNARPQNREKIFKKSGRLKGGSFSKKFTIQQNNTNIIEQQLQLYIR
jgi:hypothetical protein